MTSKQAVKSFLDAKCAASLSDRTIEWYSYTLGTYLVYCLQNKLQYEKPDTVTAFLAYLRTCKYAAATVSGFCTALAAWFNWLVRRKVLEESPMHYVDRPRRVRKRKRFLSQAQFMHLYDSIGGKHWRDWRDRALLLLMFYSGLRRNELLGLRLCDVDRYNHLIAVIGGKGGHDRTVPCHPHAVQDLGVYLETRPASRQSWLWLSDDGAGGVRGCLSRDGLRMMLKRRCRDARMEYYNPHAFRHSFAMWSLNAGMELSAVSDALGHSDTHVTEEAYAYWLTDGLVRQYTATLRRSGAEF